MKLKSLLLCLAAACLAQTHAQPTLANTDDVAKRQSAVESFGDRFDDSVRYANGDGITNLSTAPRVGAVWRIAQDGSQINPTITIPPVATSTFQGEADDDTLTIAAGHTFRTGFPVRLTGAGLPSPLVINTTYYVIRISGTVVKLATSSANALAGTAINLTTDGSASQGITAYGMARGLTPSDGAGLFYLGSSVNASAGKMVLGFEFTPVETDRPTGTSDLGLNISFSPTEMISDAGSSIAPTGVVHINFSGNGVTTADIFGGAALTSTNKTFNGSVWPWNSRNTSWVTGQRQLILFVVEGDYLRVICPGHGEVEFTHPDISSKLGATTRFWWEPSGSEAPSSQFHRRKVVLHRVTDSLEVIHNERWGQQESSTLSGSGQSNVLTRMRVLGDPAVAWTSGNEPSGGDDYHVATPRKMRADKGFWMRPFSGSVDFPVPLTANLVTAEISSGAGDSNTSRLSISDLPLAAVGDWTAFDVTGSFAANANNKGVQIHVGTLGAAIAETGSIAANGGTWRARFKRVYLTGRSHDYYGEISVTTGGVTTVYTGRLENNSGVNAFSIQVRLTGTAAGDVKIQQGAITAEVR